MTTNAMHDPELDPGSQDSGQLTKLGKISTQDYSVVSMLIS